MTHPVDYEDFADWPRSVQSGYLRHPTWRRRCHCGVYGLPWADVEAVCADDRVRHDPDRCQPFAEVVW